LSAALVRDFTGKPTHITAVFQDITERKWAIEQVRLSYERVKKSLKDITGALAYVVEKRDPYTAGHQLRVSNVAAEIAKGMGLSEDDVAAIRMAGILHDIGKIGVPAEILSRPGKLGGHEVGVVRDHVEVGYEILKDIEFEGPVADIVRQHHERMDGSGYPNGLSGRSILRGARILAVADVVEGMASHRPYRPALGLDKALDEITRNRGVLYDPDVVDVCVKIVTEKGFSFD
jgi:putative nucleotidyltransferase with HDIG domain